MNTKTIQYKVTRHEIGQRLDNFLIRHYTRLPKARIYRAIRKGEIRVNSGRQKPLYRLQLGDVIRLPPLQQALAHGKKIIFQEQVDALIKHILYQDDDLIVLNKPSNLAVHGGSGIQQDVVAILQEGLHPEYLRLVHRLDKQTCGCLLLAKNRDALLDLQRQFTQGEVRKIYHLACQGEWQYADQYRVELALSRDGSSRPEAKVQVDPAGKKAVTIFELLAQYRDFCYLKAQLLTGRTHQIRVHAQALGYPILGDDKYMAKNHYRDWQQRGIKNLMLQAHTIEFTHPRSLDKLSFTATDDLLAVMQGGCLK